MGTIEHLAKGKIEPKEAFYLMARVRTDQSSSLLSGVNSSTNYNTMYVVCMNKLQEENKNLFYLSCDPEDYMTNRLGSSKANGAVEFFYNPSQIATFGTHHLSYKNNLHHTTGYVETNSFSSKDNTYSAPPGAEINFYPSKEYEIPIENHQGPAYNLTINGRQINFYFRKNSSQSGTKRTFKTLVNLTDASPKFISLNRSYLQLSSSDYTSTDEGFTINTIANANKINKLKNGVLLDSAGNYFEYKIVNSTKDVQIIGTAKWNSSSSGAAIDKTGNIYFVLSSNFDDSFTNLETLVGDGYSSNTQYLDFFMLKKKSYGSGLNKHVSHGLNTSSSNDKFYSAYSGTLCNPHIHGVLIHFILAYIDTDKTTVNNYASIKTNARNNNPTQPHVLHSKAHDSALEIDYSYARTGTQGGAVLGVQEGSGSGPKLTYSSVNSAQLFKFNRSEYEYNKTMDYIIMGGLVLSGIGLMSILIVYLIKLNKEEEKKLN